MSELMPKVNFPGRIMPTYDSELTGQADSLKSLVRSAKYETERNAITSALEKTHGNRKAAARFCELAIELCSTRFSNTISPSDQRWQSSAVVAGAELKKLVSADILTQIPLLTTPEEEKQQQRIALRNLVGVSAVSVCILAGVAISYLHGQKRMYKAFWKLTKNPFEITPDPAFLSRPKATTRPWLRSTMVCAGKRALSC